MEVSGGSWWWLSLILILIPLFLLKFISKRSPTLPPGPLTIPIIGNLLFLRKSFSQLEPILRNLHAKYGPVVSLRIGTRRAVFIADRVLAHQALIHNGAIFADRPPALPTTKLFNSNQHNISSARYGPTWRLLRRNITSEILHPSRVKSYSSARKWVLDILLKRLEFDAQSDAIGVRVMDHFQYAMFCLLVLMCFGDKLDESKIKEIEAIQRRMLLAFSRFSILNFWLSLTKILFRKRWQDLLQLRDDQREVLVPLINSRKKVGEAKVATNDDDFVLCYVDTLLGLELPEEKRKLDIGEMVSLSSEFLNAGTDTTSTALQWIMANIVKHPQIQGKLYEEIKGVVGNDDGRRVEIEEEDLQKMPYLKAVILEGLRRHPPAHFVVPHAVSEDVVVGGHVVPKKASVNFMVAEMGWDPKVWEDPMAFKPERFLAGDDSKVEFDITGNREIKMMPFGAGRRICPGSGLAMLHLEYFVANLVWKFEWNKVDDDVNLSEVQKFTVVMKNPLHVRLTLRH
ncbi:cytochrome P450 89A2-like [Humulus lupulus]|uniref:cytochrome P450 89A2-like n=1 Tax=Humulus lupulus TaxID=3486 RepID=UPI002B40C679|nr:cytochrome P450 89A2-like [Humulus lupulus]XP_062119647.1 cytochrome P450 89A2-like [Humulus lupulus]XP_062119686.1 cytochrome P450 89A2-like [Humulus lupulus]